MTDRKKTYDSLRQKMEDAGFEFERDQKPHRQNRKELELVFIHPKLINKFETDGYKVNAHKFYIKPPPPRPRLQRGRTRTAFATLK